jgi:hypothetical protein
VSPISIGETLICIFDVGIGPRPRKVTVVGVVGSMVSPSNGFVLEVVVSVTLCEEAGAG